MANLLDTILSSAKASMKGASTSGNKDIGDVLNYLKETGQAWANLPGQVSQQLKGQKITPNKNLSRSAQRGMDLVTGVLMAGQPEAGAESVASSDLGATANEGLNAAKATVREAQAQPGGLQAGFIKLGGEAKPQSPVRVVLDPSVYGAGREAAVQQTVDTVVPGATATEKYANLEPTMNSLGNQIQQTMTSNPKAASMDEIMQNYDKNLNAQGIYRNSEITGGMKVKRDTVQREAQQYITDLYNSARGETNDVIPTNISDQSLYGLRKSISQDLKSVYRKIDNGTSLTDKDRVRLAAMQTVDDTLSGLHPELKGQITTQSHLYDATDSLFKAREAEVKQVQDIAKAQGNTLLSKLTYKAKQNPLAAIGLSAATGGAVTAAGGMAIPGAEYAGTKLIDYLKNSGKPQSAASDGKVTAQTYSLPDPMQAGIIMNQNDYIKQKSALQKELAYEQQYKLPTAGITQGKMDALDTQFGQQKQLRDAWSNANNTGVSQQLTVANYAAKGVQAADPGLLNALQGGYDNLAKANDGKYASMASYLQYLSQQTGVDFTKYRSKDALLGAINSAVDSIKGNWNNQLKSFYGASSVDQSGIPQGPAGNNVNGSTDIPSGIKGMPSGFNFGNQM